MSSLDSTSKYSAMSYVWGLALRPFYLQTMEGKVPSHGVITFRAETTTKKRRSNPALGRRDMHKSK